MEQIAKQFDHEIAKLYIVTTCEAAIFAIAMGFVIFFFIGFTAFAVLQTIGTILLAMLFGKAWLNIQKKRIHKKLKTQLENHDIAETDFSEFLSNQTIPFEFLNLLFPPSDSSCQKS